MLEIIFVILVVIGFAAFLISTLPQRPPAPPPPNYRPIPWGTLGWTCWLIASILWAITTLNLQEHIR